MPVMQAIGPVPSTAGREPSPQILSLDVDDDFVRIDNATALGATPLTLSHPASRPSRWATSAAVPVIGEAGMQSAPLALVPMTHVVRAETRACRRDPIGASIRARLMLPDPSRAAREAQVASFERLLLPVARIGTWHSAQALRCGLTHVPLVRLVQPVLVRRHQAFWIYEQAAFMHWWRAFGTVPCTNRRFALMGLYRPVLAA